MAVLQMQEFSICALKKKQQYWKNFRLFGALEVNVSFPEEEEHSLQKMDTVESRQTFDKNATLADNALEVLQEFAPERTSMFSLHWKAKLSLINQFMMRRQNEKTRLSIQPMKYLV